MKKNGYLYRLGTCKELLGTSKFHNFGKCFFLCHFDFHSFSVDGDLGGGGGAGGHG